jgi:hypothetical protein
VIAFLRVMRQRASAEADDTDANIAALQGQQ